MKKRHYSHPHNTTRSTAISAYNVLTQQRRLDDERNMAMAGEYWKRLLAIAGLTAHTEIGSKSKVEKFMRRYADEVERYNAEGTPTDEIVRELEMRTGISLEVKE